MYKDARFRRKIKAENRNSQYHNNLASINPGSVMNLSKIEVEKVIDTGKLNSVRQSADMQQVHLPGGSPTPDLLDLIEEKLCQYQWSPEQISGWLKLKAMGSISHERIYQPIWKDKPQEGKLYKHLQHRGKNIISEARNKLAKALFLVG